MAEKQPVLTFHDFRGAFRTDSGWKEVLRGVNFSLYPGETTALVGESGSGKTVSASSILRLLGDHFRPAGEILYQSENLLDLSESRLRQIRGKEISMVFQEPMTSLNPLHTVEKQLAESVKIHLGLEKKEGQKKILYWLNRVGLKDPESRLRSYPHQLSGGERQRVMLAMALIHHPKVLIADEPTTALDVTIQRQILKLIRDLQKELGLAVLFITHDLGIVEQVAHSVVVMKDGDIIEQGQVSKLFGNPQKDYTRQLLGKGLDIQPTPIEKGKEPLLKVQNLKVHYPMNRPLFFGKINYLRAVDGVSFNLYPGETIGLVGESGSGKSSLGRGVINLEASLAGGCIELEGIRIDRATRKEMLPLRKEIQILFQDPFGSLSPRLTVSEILEEGLELHTDMTPEERLNKIRSVVEEVGLSGDILSRYPHEFSGGQRQRIALARVLVLNPKVLVLDEPTSSLDRSVQFQVVKLLQKLQLTHKLAYIFISHDLRLARSLCHRLLIMKEGVIREEGPTERVISQPQNSYTRDLLISAGILSE